jgi:hypothetical protein
LGNNSSYIRIPLSFVKPNSFYFLSDVGCGRKPSFYLSTVGAPRSAIELGHFLADKINALYDEFSAFFDQRSDSVVAYATGCPRTLWFCKADCIVAEISHAPFYEIRGYDRSCVSCRYRDFSVVHAYHFDFDAVDAAAYCPECPDYSEFYETRPGRARNGVPVEGARISFSGKLGVSAVTGNPRIDVYVIVDGERRYFQHETGSRHFFWVHPFPGTYTAYMTVGENDYCVYEIPIQINEAPCFNDEITLDFFPPNILWVPDESGCGFGSVTVNNQLLPLESVVPVSDMPNHYYLISLTSNSFYNILYRNDCGCFKAGTFAGSETSVECIGTDYRNRIVSFFRVLNHAVSTNFEALSAVALPPAQTDRIATIKQFIRSNCGSPCIELVQAAIPPPATLDRFFDYVFQCGQTLNYFRYTRTTNFRPTGNVRRIVEDVFDVTIDDFSGYSRYYFKFVGLVVTYADIGNAAGPTVLRHASAAAYKELPLNLGINPIVYTVDESMQSSNPIVFSFNPPYSELTIF